METIWDIGIQVVLIFQSMGSWLVKPMEFFSFLGTEQFFLLLLPLLYWSINSAVGLKVGIILLLSNGLNGFFKFAFHHPRPYWYSNKVIAYASESSFGIPSGHAQNAVAIWGMMAIGFRRGWLWALALFLMFMIGISRIYLAVHFFTDVLFGWFLGAILLFLVLKFWDPVAAWLQDQTFAMQLTTAFLASVLLMGVYVFPRLFLSDWTMPPEWAANITYAFPDEPLPDPLNASGAITLGGVLFGFGAGLAWMNTKGGFKSEGTAGKRALRFVLGMVGIAIIYVGLDLLFPDGYTLIPNVFRYIRYAFLGAWISGIAPFIFIKLKLS